VVIGLAALLPPEGSGEAADRDGEMPLPSVLLPYAVLSCALAAAIYTVAAGVHDPAMEATSAFLVVMVVARQLLTLIDNRCLNATLRDKVVELGTRERELQRLVLHDPLTGLPNRAAFLDRVEAAVASRSANPSPLSVLFVDLDDFKAVNDTLGHDAGDELLAEAAARLRSKVGDAMAARLGGDEFGVLVEGHDAGPPTELAAEIHEAFRGPFGVRHGQMVVRASIGIAHSEVGDASGHELLRQADIAMYAAKRRGKGSSQVFGPDLADGATERVLLRSALASALDADALDLHYQPIVELASGRVWGVEALSRWTDGERGSIPPAEFIPLSEESGLIHQLGRLALKHACEEAAGWPGGYSAPVLSVNVSSTQLQDASIVGVVSDALAASGLPPERLMVEVSENILLTYGEPVRQRLSVLRELGVRVAIDDFGVGSSSLRHLARFPVDVIKIDQILIRGIDDGAAGLAVLRAIVELADRLGLDTVGEGIEEIRQADALASVGCRSGQGYWYRRPVPASQLWPLPSGGVLRPRRTSADVAAPR
jgi:diguanylate cyclase (GGDEF)-like protein